MLPLNKDNLCIVGIIVCVIGIFYLYREMLKLKKMTVARPSQPVPMETFVPHRVQTPVYDTPVQVPVPAVVSQPPVQVPVSDAVPQPPSYGETKPE
jgi:hypothetical protein